MSIITTLTPTNIAKTSITFHGNAVIWTLPFDGTNQPGVEIDEVITNTLTIPANCVLYMECTGNSGFINWSKNNEDTWAWGPYQEDPEDPESPVIWIWYNQTLSFNENDTLAIKINNFLGGPMDGDITIKLNTVSGRTLSQFHYAAEGSCYLTTSCVGYKELEDNCSELTAMRLLREHYINEPEYIALISEYNQLSRQIINMVNQEINPDIIYEQIYQSVKICETAINNEDWQTARNEYLGMYYQLAETYIPNYQRLMPL